MKQKTPKVLGNLKFFVLVRVQAIQKVPFNVGLSKCALHERRIESSLKEVKASKEACKTRHVLLLTSHGCFTLKDQGRLIQTISHMKTENC